MEPVFTMEKQLVIDNVQITICDTRIEMGLAAARHTENLYRHILSERGVVNMIFAAAPSQDEYLESLIKKTEIDFSRVNAFHMDEYIGLEKDAPASFGVYLKTHIFDKTAFKSINYIDGNVETCSEECFRYGKLISAFPVDIVCAGVGENGHIAFNDPEFADFNDPQIMKVVELDNICRQQQVNDGCFPSINYVPKKALTLTIPTLMNAKYRVFVIPSKRKAKAVHDMFLSSRNETVPASVIQGDSCSSVFLDRDSAELLLKDL